MPWLGRSTTGTAIPTVEEILNIVYERLAEDNALYSRSNRFCRMLSSTA